MKRVLPIFVFVSMISVGAFAQGVSGGLKAGLNLANQSYSGDFTSDPDLLPGIHAGGYLTVMFSKHIGLQPEVLYSGQGAKSGDTSLKLNYVAIPILLRFNINSIISFHAGPQIGLLAAAKLKYDSDTDDVKDLHKSTDVGIAVGGTIDLPMGLNFTARFIQGLTDINDTTLCLVPTTHKRTLTSSYRLGTDFLERTSTI